MALSRERLGWPRTIKKKSRIFGRPEFFVHLRLIFDGKHDGEVKFEFRRAVVEISIFGPRSKVGPESEEIAFSRQVFMPTSWNFATD